MCDKEEGCSSVTCTRNVRYGKAKCTSPRLAHSCTCDERGSREIDAAGEQPRTDDVQCQMGGWRLAVAKWSPSVA